MPFSASATDIAAQLVRVGIRPSVQRMAVAGYLFESHSHPTAEEIYSALSPSMPTLSRTTVYNTLKTLVAARLAMTVEASTPDAVSHFDSALRGDHAHFICNSCGRIIDLPAQPVSLPVSDKFQIDSASTSFRGLCRQCLDSR